jgi:hypothetical protein
MSLGNQPVEEILRFLEGCIHIFQYLLTEFAKLSLVGIH